MRLQRNFNTNNGYFRVKFGDRDKSLSILKRGLKHYYKTPHNYKDFEG